MSDSGCSCLASSDSVKKVLIHLRCLVEVNETRAEEEHREENWGDLVRCIVVNATFDMSSHVVSIVDELELEMW